MRIVALADTHMLHDKLRVPAGDVLVHAGDLTRNGELGELARTFAWLASLPHATSWSSRATTISPARRAPSARGR